MFEFVEEVSKVFTWFEYRRVTVVEVYFRKKVHVCTLKEHRGLFTDHIVLLQTETQNRSIYKTVQIKGFTTDTEIRIRSKEKNQV